MQAPVDILFEDNHLLALNKPPNLLSQDSGTGRDNLEDRARDYLARSRNKPGRAFLHTVHRLDRPASGIVLCACTSKALGRLQEAQRRGTWRKTYHALLQGRLSREDGTLQHWLQHGDRKAVVTAPEAAGAKRAVLQYRVLAERDGDTLVEVILETGRYHQIRAQWAAEGHPLLGDTQYGGPEHRSDGIALHHRELQLEHPVGRDALVIQAAYPPESCWPG